MSVVNETVKTSRMPGDGPDAVLKRMVSLLHLPDVRADQITLAIATHPRPTSLLALVDVARQLGLNVTPAKAEAGGLPGLKAPFVAHFQGPDGDGFGVVQAVSESNVEVWDSASGSRDIDRDEFLSGWSGVVVLMEPSAEAAGVMKRVSAFLAGGVTPAVVGGAAAGVVRAGVAAVVLALLGFAVASQPADLRWGVGLLAVLGAVGLMLTSVMSVAIAGYGGPFSPGICKRGKLVDCQSVLTSRFAKFLGFPLSDLGISFYAAILLTLGVTGAGVVSAPFVAGIAFVTSLPFALVLIGLQLRMKRLCTLCLGVHAVNATGAAAAWLLLLDGAARSDLVATALVFVLFFAIGLFFAVPYVKNTTVLTSVTAAHSRVSVSPFGSLAQLTTERPTELSGPAFGVEIGGSGARDELVAFVHPSCNQCEAVLREIRSLAAADVVHAYMAIPPRDENEVRLCEMLVAIGLAAGPLPLMKAFAFAKDRPQEMAGDPTNVLCGAAEIDPGSLQLVAERASEIVNRTAAFSAAHVEGTPMVFFNSLPYRGPIAHLMTLIRQHSELLPRFVQQ